jgi:capsid protein
MISPTQQPLGWTRNFASGYDAVDRVGQRRPVSPILKSEDNHLRPTDARKMQASSRDLARNFSLVGWVIRQHLNYLTEFDFQCHDDAIGEQVEQLMHQWSRPANCDAAGRHDLWKLIRLTEQRKIVDGDLVHLKLSEGTLQGIEADRIQDPPDKIEGETWVSGFRINKAGRPVEVSIFKRDVGGGMSFEKRVGASNFIHYANTDRFDQIRGISPLAAAINSFKDVYEAIDLALAKMKVEQLFALVVTRESTEATGETTGNESEGYEVDFKSGPIKMELDPGDDAKYLSSNNPGNDTQAFIKLVIRIALTSLDLPYGLFDTGDTNFFGGKAGFMVYERSLLSKIRDLQNVLRQITLWKLRQWILDGSLVLPRGMTVADVPFEWVHRGMPWWDASKEIAGDLDAIAAGLTDPYTVCKRRGLGEFEENVARIAKARAYADSMGVPIQWNRAGSAAVREPISPSTPEPAQVDDGVENA